jgi:hypothetical protein
MKCDGHGSSNTEKEDLALALRLSQLSSDALEERCAQFHPEGSASSKDAPHPTTPCSYEKDNLALAPNVSPRSGDACEEQIIESHPSKYVPASNEAHHTTPSSEDDPELVHVLSQLPADSFDDEQVGQFNQPRESCAEVGRTVISRLKVRTRRHASASVDH